MIKYIIAFLTLFSLSACVSLSYQEKQDLQKLRSQDISVDRPCGNWAPPANPVTAGLLNLLPGVGTFYLAGGNAGDSALYVPATLNLLTWPISILWGVPEGVIDANTINKQDLLYYYNYKYKKEEKA